LGDVAERVLDAVAVVFCVWMIVDGLRTGKARVPLPYVDTDYEREHEPVHYWITIVALALCAVVAANLFAETLH
jgi:hypothetical protein